MEGPSIVILKEQVQVFIGKKVLGVEGSSKIDLNRLKEQTVTDFKSWGKHFIICFEQFAVRIHFLMFGSYRINERKDAVPRLSLQFDTGELNFYSCAIKMLDENPDEIYDWSLDVLSESWNPRKARKTLKANPSMMVCDALLNQDIFAGVGNIIKNEVLFRVGVHPETKIASLPPRKLTALIDEAREYSFDFYHWKKQYVLKKHWLIYTKKKCPRCRIPVIKRHTGETSRRSFFCENCQKGEWSMVNGE
jgi:endonuclease-8